MLPELFAGQRSYVIGGGPSVSRTNIELLKGKCVVGTNDAFKYFPWIPVTYWMDNSWYNWNKAEVHKFEGLKVTTCSNARDAHGIFIYQHGDRNAFDTRPDRLSRGASAGFGAAALCYKLGSREIILVGFDMQVEVDEDGNESHNYHSNHKRDVPANIYKNQHMKSFAWLAGAQEKLGVKVINCTPGSTMDYFPIEPLEDWV